MSGGFQFFGLSADSTSLLDELIHTSYSNVVIQVIEPYFKFLSHKLVAYIKKTFTALVILGFQGKNPSNNPRIDSTLGRKLLILSF